ncbi:MAG: FHA domain-containing protein [Anaerolineae bacterium]|nr:FHA domain-containing protein [Anaerolineae bacterium]
MQQCSNCGHRNRAGVVFCENCGASLIGKMPLDTKSLDSSTEEEKSLLGVDESVITDTKVQGEMTFVEGASLRLDIEGSSDPILFKPEDETIFGRRDPATGAMPNVDLTPFAGYRMGVSRRHAAIRHADGPALAVWDLGSSNGTFLNGQRLNAHRPYPLHDGDELRLGQMTIHVYFETVLQDVPAAPVEAPEKVTIDTELTDTRQKKPGGAKSPTADLNKTDQLSGGGAGVATVKAKPAEVVGLPLKPDQPTPADKLVPAEPQTETEAKKPVTPPAEKAPPTKAAAPTAPESKEPEAPASIQKEASEQAKPKTPPDLSGNNGNNNEEKRD